MAKRRRQWPPVSDPLPVAVMDNHTHLPLHYGEIPTADGVKLSLDDQLARAQQVGVDRIITVGCTLPDWEPTLELAKHHPQVRVALAVHPNEAALHAGFTDTSPDGYSHHLEEHHIPLDDALAQLEVALADPLVVAVGETGLDHFRTGDAGQKAQVFSFEAHLEMAAALGLPLQIHDREAHAETLGVLKRVARADQEIVFHSFSGDAAMARELAENGWYASFSGPLTYPANQFLRDALMEMPRELVLVETDAPYLTPVPYRGSPNASYVMTHTVRALAQLWGLSDEEAGQILSENSDRLYGSWV